MAADITKHFRATVRAVRSSSSPSVSFEPVVRSNPDPAFRELSTRLAVSLTRAGDLVRSAHDSFIAISAERGGWSEQDRERVEEEAESLLTACRKGVIQLESEAMISPSLPDQVRQHRRAVVEFLRTRLISTARILSDHAEVRKRRAAFQQRLAATAPRVNGEVRRRQMQEEPEQEEFSEAEVQMLTQENAALLHDMTERMADVQTLHSRVSEIAKLQNVFAENVASQATLIDRIAEQSIASTENVKEGNEQLRDAMKNRASYRFWLLFCLIVLTLSLLFLDWYNP